MSQRPSSQILSVTLVTEAIITVVTEDIITDNDLSGPEACITIVTLVKALMHHRKMI